MTASGIVAADGDQLGYRRPAELQEQFDQAAEQLCRSEGWVDPAGDGSPRLVADLALEGGGVKGIGLVGAVIALSEAGYSFPRVAGTSAGAITASVIAALTAAGEPMVKLGEFMHEMQYSHFMREGKLHTLLDGHLIVHAAQLVHRRGLYSGEYLEEFLRPRLEALGVRSFGDLKLTERDDPDMSLPSGLEYRLVVHTTDISRGRLVRLPRDYAMYGLDADTADVVQAVRASMAIPLIFDPVTVEARAASVECEPGGHRIVQEFEAGTVTWVDGGLLRNFPIDAFDRVDGRASRWPTIGIKLSSLQTWFPATTACANALAVGLHCLRTMTSEWDSYLVDRYTAGRTIFIDHAGLAATDFDLSAEQRETLFLNGVEAGTRFVIEMAGRSGPPAGGD